ncbi:EAL domain-containing protein [Vibrio rumoiensis]|uniref:cyclic-guanylate-specific phosphodiesterase n=1 Tax=Vibrio rumoiensis 1S-45 TaxID=1188252 RepID=A0A1E5E2N6_9VIBR|nr:EAL domain-containing protein [Vibrio rumoiensis]OEF25779.1 hypothetical protein A1QC_08420 [Vibrio rumoiensis 1S-45]
MINKIKNTLKYRQWLISIAASIGIFSVGTSIIIAQSIKSYDANVLTRLGSVVSIIETKLESTDEIINRIMPLTGMPCSTAEHKLIDIIVEYAEFQTLNIIKNNIVACSTNSRMVNAAYVTSDKPNNELSILESSVVTPGKIIGAIKEVHNKNGVLVTFNGKIFYSILEHIDDSDNFRIQSSKIWFDKEGIIHYSTQRSNLMVASEKYNFNINTNVSTQDYVNEIIQNNTFLIILFAVISLIIGRYVFLNAQKNSSLFIMKESIADNEFTPYAQPVMDSNGKLSGLEILIRWNNKHHGLIYPDVFIPLAEASGLIIPMTTQLMENTFNLLTTVEKKVPNDFHIGINISAQHFDKTNQQSLIASCKKYTDSSLNAKTHLVLELTERQAIHDYDETQSVFDTLHEMDIKMAIDDFGTGHSTLSDIKNLNFDFIKIDKSFIDLIGSDAIAAPLVDNIIDLAQRLELAIVAEGVETQEQLDYLRTHNVDYIQGYYYSKPIPLTEFIEQYFT